MPAIAQPPQDTRRPVPGAADRSAALERIKRVFAAEYAAPSVEAKETLAKALRDAAGDSAADAERWVLLVEAMRLGAECGAVEICFSAADTAARTFAADDRRLRFDVIEKLAPRTSANDARTVAVAAMEVAAAYRDAGDIDAATKLLTTSGMLARKSKDAELIATTKKLLADLKGAEAAQKATAGLLARLEANPDDPKLCREAGIHFCFERGDWDRGLPLLLKSEEESLVAAARADLLTREKESARVTAANAWAAWAATQRTPAVKAGAEQRAYELYSLALEKLDGLERTAVRKRMASLGGGAGGAFAKAKNGPAAIPGMALWLDAADPSSVVSGRKGANAQRVARWKDLSGSGNDAGQSDEGRQPTYRAGFVEFDGKAGLALAGPLSMNAMTLLVLYEPAADAPQRPVLVSSVTPRFDAGFQADLEAGAVCLRAFTGGPTEFNLGPQPVKGPRFLLASISEAGAMVIRHMADKLDQPMTSNHAGKAFTSPVPLHIGAAPANERGFVPFKGKIFRILMYSRVLSPAEIDALVAWSAHNTPK